MPTEISFIGGPLCGHVKEIDAPTSQFRFVDPFDHTHQYHLTMSTSSPVRTAYVAEGYHGHPINEESR